ncbi:hypothetical protein E2562_025791 [Oryza meyeriana var. granulata]|uniref:Uncharacterized protein n=1 Tax=Oryza meyeriana var. granulata TaxID=110450 RepID=A0A6G1CTK9_9ORYZ|nr:hypothetical protein E2562_025791 [Oryza meyeriana var. granulata]
MEMESDFHMAIGEAVANYADNSRLQRKALIKPKPVLDKAVRQVCTVLLPPTMVVADLSCSVGINTLLFVSKIIKDMDKKMTNLNGGNIYIAKSTPPSVVKMYQDQFQKDMSLFLKLRYQELVPGGQMLLTFLGRKKEDVLDGDLSHLCALLAEALQSLVTEGLVERGKLESFNVPVYGPSIDEVKAVIAQNKLFCIDHIELFESNWDR